MMEGNGDIGRESAINAAFSMGHENLTEMTHLRREAERLLGAGDFIGFGRLLSEIPDEKLAQEPGGRIAESVADIVYTLVSGKNHGLMDRPTPAYLSHDLAAFKTMLSVLDRSAAANSKHRRIFQAGLEDGLRAGARTYGEEGINPLAADGRIGFAPAIRRVGDGYVDPVLPTILDALRTTRALDGKALTTALAQGVTSSVLGTMHKGYNRSGKDSAYFVRTSKGVLVQACAQAVVHDPVAAIAALRELDKGPKLDEPQRDAYDQFKTQIRTGLRAKGIALFDLRGVFWQATTGNYATVDLNTPNSSIVFEGGFPRTLGLIAEHYREKCASKARLFTRLAAGARSSGDHDARMACEQAVVALRNAPKQPSIVDRAVGAVKSLASGVGRAVGRSPA